MESHLVRHLAEIHERDADRDTDRSIFAKYSIGVGSELPTENPPHPAWRAERPPAAGS
jgi:hypothetical protein